MNWLDIVLLVLFALSIVVSFRKGFTREVIGLVATFIAFIGALWFYGAAGGWLMPWVSSRGVANFCGFFLIFCGVLLVGALAGHVLSRILSIAGLSWFDRILGAGFGVVRGFLLAVALVMAILAFTPGHKTDAPPRSVVNSRLAPYVIDAARLFASMAPEELKSGFRRHYDEVKRAWEDAWKHGVRRLRAKT